MSEQREKVMNCQRLQESLWLYLYDEMAPEERAAAESHLEDCASCRAHLTEAEGLGALLSQRMESEPPPELLAESRLALDDALDREERSWRGWYRNFAYSVPVFYASRAASVFAVLVLGFGMGWLLGPKPAAGNGEIAQVPPAADATPALNSSAGLQNYRIQNIRELVPDPLTGTVRITLDAQGQMTLSGSLGNPQIQRVLLDTVRGYENAGIRRDTLGILRQYAAQREIRDTLIYAMQHDSNDGVRMEALDTLRTLEWSPQLRDAFLGVLRNDTNAGVRVAAVNALVRNADRQILPVLREFAESDENTYVRMQCASVVRELEGEEF